MSKSEVKKDLGRVLRSNFSKIKILKNAKKQGLRCYTSLQRNFR